MNNLKSVHSAVKVMFIFFTLYDIRQIEAGHLGGMMQPAKTSVSPRSSSLRTFRAEERLRLSDRNSILMMQINVYIINPVVMGFQI